MKNFCYLFVFNKNVEKTDISRGELISLIELQKKEVVIHIESIEKMENQYSEITFENIEKYSAENNFTNIIFLNQSAIVISKFKLNIKEIIRRSGYIHSGGKFLFLKKWEDIDIESVHNHVVNFCKKEKVWHNIVFYKKSENNIENKLDSLLIDDKRYHIKNSAFNVATTELDNKLKNTNNTLGLPVKNEHIFIFLEKTRIKNDSILSDLYEDRNVIDYGICYLSEFKKENPIHEMDELKEIKPFWAGIFTTPHRLMNAMLNLAKVEDSSIVVDPFSHTGTLAIEASNIGCKVIASDIMGTNGAKDNYDFLCTGSKNFNHLVNKIINHTKDIKLKVKLQALTETNIKLNEQGLPETKGDISNQVKKLDERLYYYIIRRYAMELSRGSDQNALDDFVQTYINEPNNSNDFKPGYVLFGKQFEIFEKASSNNEPIVELNSENENFFIDSYYKSPRVGYINVKKENYPIFQSNDICDANDDYNIAESSVDAVITDPPYGYGEGLDSNKVKEIYTNLIEKSIKWLKPNGYMVFCALDKVKTGRTENLLFTEEILDIINFTAKRNKVQFVMNNVLLTSKHLKNVYYWKSKYALNRSIIALQINK